MTDLILRIHVYHIIMQSSFSSLSAILIPISSNVIPLPVLLLLDFFARGCTGRGGTAAVLAHDLAVPGRVPGSNSDNSDREVIPDVMVDARLNIEASDESAGDDLSVKLGEVDNPGAGLPPEMPSEAPKWWASANVA
jgi:hypothetical protein